jgi:DNA-binding response OmpR family regulator
MKAGDRNSILIIEDSDKFRSTILQLLSDDYNVIGVNDASKGLASCESFKPDIILLDIMLPGNIDGFSFLRIIKKDKSLAHIPVIIISALASNDKITEGLKLGANDYLIKPFDLIQLDLKIKNQLSISSNLRENILIEQHIPFTINNDSRDVLKEFEMILEENILKDKSLSIKDFAKLLNISQSTLERLIKKGFGISPNKYILERKLEKADILLHSNKGISIKEVSFLFGFSSVSYFSRCYKKVYGRSPSSHA